VKKKKEKLISYIEPPVILFYSEFTCRDQFDPNVLPSKACFMSKRVGGSAPTDRQKVCV